jgi:hypothetical protein
MNLATSASATNMASPPDHCCYSSYRQEQAHKSLITLDLRLTPLRFTQVRPDDQSRREALAAFMRLKTGGNEYGSRNSALAYRCSYSDYHPSRADLALTMALPSQTVVDRSPVAGRESSLSAVSWAAIFAGAVSAIALTIVLTSLGAGLGLTSISAWSNVGASATTFTIGAGIGLIVVQWLASALGGFVTGRLRTKWAGLHTHEVFFRDTAHGFLSWALATILGTLLLASAASSVVSGGVRAASTVAGGAAQAATSSVSSYAVDGLFRSDRIDASTSTQEAAAQATRILANGVRNGDVPPADRTYLAQLVAAKAGIPQADAQKRVDDTIAGAKDAEVKARQAADAARKATATFAIFTALALLIGAFVAMAAAAFGGNLRDIY